METFSFNTVPSEIQTLLLAASAAKEKAYNPYSHFFVGAALLTEEGDIVTGCNYESASFGATICAERAALVNANTRGFRRFKALAITARGETTDTIEVCAPCGVCRQLLAEAAELSGGDLACYLSNTTMSKVVMTSLSELLPLAFGPLALRTNLEQYRSPANLHS